MELLIGLFAEGSTDDAFLPTIIRRTFAEVGAEFARGPQVDILDPVAVVKGRGASYVDKALDAARNAAQAGVQILCIHLDADDATDQQVRDHKMEPALAHVGAHTSAEVCAHLVPLMPVHMLEAWMLADKDLLKRAMGTQLSNQELKLHRPPEEYTDPKEAIEEAIRLEQQQHRKRLRGGQSLNDLYAPMGDQLSLDRLAALDSYKAFRGAVRAAFRQLGYLS